MDSKNIKGKFIIKNIIIPSFFFILFYCGLVIGGIGKENKVYASSTTSTNKLIEINAYYMGESVVVGKSIDKSNLVVEAIYDDGTLVTIYDYKLTSEIVTSAGENTFVAIYKNKPAKFTVMGKKVIEVNAFYTGDLVSIGNSVDLRDIMATATYSDYSSETITDFTLANRVITKTGINTITLIYNGVTTRFEVYGTEPKSVEHLTAIYDGSGVAIGEAVNPRELTVMAIYTDGTSEVINNYVLSPDKVTAAGAQQVTASFRGKKATFTVVGIQKTVTSIKVTYNGKAVAIGNTVRAKDIEVIATYSDGTTSKITSFNILSPSFTYEGYQTVTVEASGCTADFTVEVVSQQSTDYSNATVFNATNGKHTAKVSLALYDSEDKDKITGTSVTPSLVRNVLKRSAKYNYYIAFDVELLDENMDAEFPLTMKITIPSEYKIQGCKVYYTPNKKSVIGELNTVTNGTNEIICTIYNPGTYILTYLKQ